LSQGGDGRDSCRSAVVLKERPSMIAVYWSLALLLSLVPLSLATAADAKSDLPARGKDPVVEEINKYVRQGWTDNEVQPSPEADDAEWLRRVYLDIVGHIPESSTVEKFLADKDQNKRSKVVAELVDDPRFVRHMTTAWANVLIGRNPPQRTSRSGLEKFLREAFAKNRPWNEIVYDLLTAEGHFEQNGAVNFILGQLDGNPNRDDYTVEATAKATRIFLGMQVQCTQCHDHPFNDWKQNQFWEFNSFLRQVQRRDVRRYDAASGREVDDYSELVRRNYEGPVYFETRQGLMKVAYPKYFEKEIDSSRKTNRRQQLAEVMTKSDTTHQVARAFVNRTWGQFFGYGFTRPVDDMGPHNPPSHPELLDFLTEQFVENNYDVRQLVRWICNTEAYQLTSQFNPKNEVDNPAIGEIPLFSHMYVKALTVEQLYDALIVATSADQTGKGSYDEAQQQKERWLRDFMRIFGGNDDDEPTLFSGTIPQALMLMNGDLTKQAISTEKGGFLAAVLSSPRLRNDNQRIQALYVSALGRMPTRPELTKIEKVMRQAPSPVVAYQDLYWALLNSNEFVLNH
jgi:hypothetical protein